MSQESKTVEPVTPATPGDAAADTKTPATPDPAPTSGDPAPEPKKDGDAAPAEPQADQAKPAVPETYTFQLPEGMKADEALVGKVSPVFKELGLTQEQAQKVAHVYAEHVAAQEKARLDQLAADHETWKGETLKLEEKTRDAAQRLYTKLGWKPLFDKLAAEGHPTYVFDHPEVIKGLAAVFADAADHDVVPGNPTSTPDPMRKLYPKSYDAMKR